MESSRWRHQTLKTSKDLGICFLMIPGQIEVNEFA